jgi:hypothetical protein
MTPAEHLIGFVAMASAVVAVLVIGTLAAADILHFRRRRPAVETVQTAKREQAK